MSEEKTSIVSLKQLALAKQNEKHACIIVLSGKGAGKMFKLGAGTSVIGRGTDTTIRIEDDGISRRHAQVVLMADGSVAVEDLGSTNGTFVNGEKAERRKLQDGDKIELGSTTILKFSHADNVEEEYQRNLYDSATRDPMTGCYNKKFFVDRLNTEFAYASRHEADLSLCMLDIDHFKKVNDTHGHPAGDAILKHFAALVQNMIRSEDIFCRYGGEEFSLILRQTPVKEAAMIADRIRQKLEAQVCEHAGVKIPVTCSIGLTAHQGERFASPADFLKATDDNLYRAKQGGRNRVVSS